MVWKKIVQGKTYNQGDRSVISSEEKLGDISFSIHKFNNRPRPQKQNIIIFPNFSEFGSELIQSLYCIPYFLRYRFQGKYSIVMGWGGRSFLYKHLVDEFWEINPEFQNLREYCRAFHHDSKNLKKVEEKAEEFGKVIPSKEYNSLCLYPKLKNCLDNKCKGELIYADDKQICLRCHRSYPREGLYYDIKRTKKLACWTPEPCQEKKEYVKKYLRQNSVGIFARNRKCYGRNFPKEFYEKLIVFLENQGYHVIWMGEKATNLPCPLSHIADFSITEDANDLEKTLALVSQLQFTIQFFTASSRLAGLVGTPFLLFESPDQILGQGQEGIRLNLCTKGNKKLVYSHFVNCLSDQDGCLSLVDRAIKEMKEGNYSDIIGLVEDEKNIVDMIKNNKKRIGGGE